MEQQYQQKVEQFAEAVLSAIAQKLQPKTSNDGIITCHGYRPIYLSRNGEYLFYHFDTQKNKALPVEGNAIRGVLSKADSYTKNKGDKKTEAEKLNLFFDCSVGGYRLEMGLHTVTAKALLADITQMSSSQLAGTITCKFRLGEETIFAEVVEAQRDRAGVKYEELDSLQLLKQVQALLEG